jgi:hypothetical protein
MFDIFDVAEQRRKERAAAMGVVRKICFTWGEIFIVLARNIGGRNAVCVRESVCIHVYMHMCVYNIYIYTHT